ncbi:MAG: hypothetical protein HY883_04520 [Deltaproteobacteria bacterium]|nr:hypothetical protein [Deltaproteobacteria bacterium]
MKTIMRVSLGIIFLASLGMLTGPQTAQATPSGAYLSYAAKFVCGETGEAEVVKGMYKTAVNIHNPNSSTNGLLFYKKAVLALPERNTTHGAISSVVDETLLYDEAMEVDCTDIRSLFPAGTALPKHIEGFLVIMVPGTPDNNGSLWNALDVVAKYTARHRTGTATDYTTSDVESLDVEIVWPRQCHEELAAGTSVCRYFSN